MTALARIVSELKASDASTAVTAVEFFSQRISKKTEYLFVRLGMGNGAEGWGEATYNGLNGQVLVALRQLGEAITGQSIEVAFTTLGKHPNWKHGRASAMAANALECALLDVLATERGVPLHALLGKQQRFDISCYANINRGTKSRDPCGWSKRAQIAVDAGFPAVKLAPFDSISLGLDGKSVGNAAPGVANTRAVKEAIGADAGLMIDCHWRFDADSARALFLACEELNLTWIESPILEDALSMPDLSALKALADDTGTKLAGGEFFAGSRSFIPFLRAKAYHVVNPDPRFCGVLDMYDIAIEAGRNGIHVAPHNHLGPIMTAASLHIAAVAPTALTLEMQFAEGDAEPCVKNPDQLTPVNGRMQVPTDVGLGIPLMPSTLTRFA